MEYVVDPDRDHQPRRHSIHDDLRQVSTMSREMTWSGRKAWPRDDRPSHQDAARRAPGTVRLAAQRMMCRPPISGRATDRELAVVAAVVVSGSEKAAAHRLGLSHSTVKHHLANARSKVGATTTAQLVWILRGGCRGRMPGRRSSSSPYGRMQENPGARSGYRGRVKLDPFDSSLRSLLTSPSPATLTLYREDGMAITSPVWFRVADDWFEVVVAASDAKLVHLRRDARCSLLVFETVRPFRGVQVTGEAMIVPDEGARTRLAIASAYLGPEGGREYADLARRPPGFVIRLPVASARAWDLTDKLP